MNVFSIFLEKLEDFLSWKTMKKYKINQFEQKKYLSPKKNFISHWNIRKPRKLCATFFFITFKLLFKLFLFPSFLFIQSASLLLIWASFQIIIVLTSFYFFFSVVFTRKLAQKIKFPIRSWTEYKQLKVHYRKKMSTKNKLVTKTTSKKHREEQVKTIPFEHFQARN